MKIKNQLPLQRLIGKIDNDFNIDNSDWIPRVGAWVIDALSQMKCLPMEYKKRELDVIDRVAIFPCTLNARDIRVFDSNGCEIKSEGELAGCACDDSILPTGEVIAITNPHADNQYQTTEVASISRQNGRSYVLVDNNKIDLNFDTDKIIVKSYEVATYHDDYYNCDVPYIYDNGLLLEALAWYCLFKMLSRGYKHQVYSLASGQPYLNPYQQWINLKPKAAAAVKIDLGRGTDRDGWNNFFYNSTFLPRK